MKLSSYFLNHQSINSIKILRNFEKKNVSQRSSYAWPPISEQLN